MKTYISLIMDHYHHGIPNISMILLRDLIQLITFYSERVWFSFLSRWQLRPNGLGEKHPCGEWQMNYIPYIIGASYTVIRDKLFMIPYMKQP